MILGINKMQNIYVRTSDLIPLSLLDQMERKKFYSMIQKTNIKFFLESISILTYTGAALK